MTAPAARFPNTPRLQGPHARRHPASLHHHRRHRAGLRSRHDRAAPTAAAAGGLPVRGGDGRAVHARLRGRPEPGAAVGRAGRDPADVRGGAAFLDEGTAGRQVHRHPRGHRADRAGDADGHGAGLVAGLGVGPGPGVRAGAVGGEHGGAAQGTGRPRHRGLARGPYRRRLADRRRPGDGGGAGAAARAGRCAGWRRQHRGGLVGLDRGAGGHAGQGGGLCRADAGGGPPRDSVDA